MVHSAYPIPSSVYENGNPQATPLYYYEELPSTNLTAKEIFFAESAQNRRFIVLADRQSAGRGRRGRSFFSERGLYFSIAVPAGSFSLPAELLTTAAAAAVCRAAIQEGFDTKIKWVNDIMLDGKKVCGILAEALSESDTVLGYVVGIGVNIGKPDFPEEIADIAGALSGGTQLKFKLFEEIRVNFFASLNEAPQKLISYCTEKSYVIGKKIRYFGAADGFGKRRADRRWRRRRKNHSHRRGNLGKNGIARITIKF